MGGESDANTGIYDVFVVVVVVLNHERNRILSGCTSIGKLSVFDGKLLRESEKISSRDCNKSLISTGSKIVPMAAGGAAGGVVVVAAIVIAIVMCRRRR